MKSPIWRWALLALIPLGGLEVAWTDEEVVGYVVGVNFTQEFHVLSRSHKDRFVLHCFDCYPGYYRTAKLQLDPVAARAALQSMGVLARERERILRKSGRPKPPPGCYDGGYIYLLIEGHKRLRVPPDFFATNRDPRVHRHLETLYKTLVRRYERLPSNGLRRVSPGAVDHVRRRKQQVLKWIEDEASLEAKLLAERSKQKPSLKPPVAESGKPRRTSKRHRSP